MAERGARDGIPHPAGSVAEGPGRPACPHPSPDTAPVAVLDGPGRLRALAESGLTEVSDPGMEFYAGQVRDRLGVPVA
ncbi:MAG TPA: hypothetical protein VFE65_03245, partial [Pseudonocardia sp.]|nr:hypothetical protein [Pseudonocardia sp.]